MSQLGQGMSALHILLIKQVDVIDGAVWSGSILLPPPWFVGNLSYSVSAKMWFLIRPVYNAPFIFQPSSINQYTLSIIKGLHPQDYHNSYIFHKPIFTFSIGTDHTSVWSQITKSVNMIQKCPFSSLK